MVDARGFSCPKPVLMTEEEINKNNPDEFVVLVDNRTAENNVSNFAIEKGYKVTHEREGRDFKLILKK
ncbi:MAG: sulfurtransferase TusA family protein [Lachnospiraceae bacterium]|nr:sulfurtransferase TusA family protein [Lachnospiraceae bacterium]